MLRGLALCKPTSPQFLALRVTQAYVGLSSVPQSETGARSVSLARCGNRELRLIELSIASHDGEPPLWVELYDHDIRASIDSCRCSDLEEAVSAAEYLLSQQLGEGQNPSDGKDDSE